MAYRIAVDGDWKVNRLDDDGAIADAACVRLLMRAREEGDEEGGCRELHTRQTRITKPEWHGRRV
jgi:hypothetical protein